MSTTTTTVSTQQPVQSLRPWSTDLCGCFADGSSCCIGLFCPCCLYGENQQQLDGESSQTHCCIYFMVSLIGCCCIPHMSRRRLLRQKFGLIEECDDCIVTALCAPCANCQESRELRYHSKGAPAPQVMVVNQSPPQPAPVVQESAVAQQYAVVPQQAPAVVSY